jgi:hypothetical protein
LLTFNYNDGGHLQCAFSSFMATVETVPLSAFTDLPLASMHRPKPVDFADVSTTSIS